MGSALKYLLAKNVSSELRFAITVSLCKLLEAISKLGAKLEF
jgi:hypothetical protein